MNKIKICALVIAGVLGFGSIGVGCYIGGQQDRYNSYSIELAEQKSDFQKIEESLANVKKQLQEKVNECSSLKSSVENLQKEKTKLAQENEQIKQEIQFKTGKINELTNQNQQKDTEIGRLSSQIETLTQEKAEKEEEIQRLQQEAQTNTERISQLEGEVTEKESSISDLQGQVQSLTSEKEQNQFKIAELTGQVSQLQESVSEKEQKITQLQGQISTLESSVSDKEQQISTLTNQLSQAQSQYEELQQTYQQLEESVSGKDQTISELQEEIAKLKKQIEELQGQIKVFTGELDTITSVSGFGDNQYYDFYWTDGTNIYCDFKGKFDFSTNEWSYCDLSSGLPSSYSSYRRWSSGGKVYLSCDNTKHFVFNGNGWDSITFETINDFTNFSFKFVSGTAYLYNDSECYALEGNSWVSRHYIGFPESARDYNAVWTDGENYYCCPQRSTYNATFYILKENVWELIDLKGLYFVPETYFEPGCIWFTGKQVYYDNEGNHFVLRGDKWERHSWKGNSSAFDGTRLCVGNSFYLVNNSFVYKIS